MIPLVLLAGAIASSATSLGLLKGLNKFFSLDDKFTPEQQAQRLEKYIEQIGLGKDSKYSAGDFDTYIKTRDESVSKLDSIFKDTKVLEAIKNSTTVKNTLQSALGANPGKANTDPTKSIGSLAAAQKDYEDSAKVFGKLLEKRPRFRAEQLIQTMDDLRGDGVKSIEAQHAYEKANLSDKFANDTAFQQALTGQGITDLAATKTAMLADLEKAHASQLNAFKDSTAASVRKLHDAARQEMERIIFLAALSENNPKMKALIRLKANEINTKQGVPPETLVGATGKSTTDPNVGVVQLSDLDTIYSRTGKTITQDQNGNFTLDLGRAITDPLYYVFGNKVQSDMDLLARTIKSQGHKSIEMDINFNHPELIKERAQQAYEACINAGYPPDKIKINHGGKAMSLDDIFGKGSPIPGHLKKRSDEVIQKEEKLFENKSKDTINTAPVKAAMKELRALEADAALAKHAASVPLPIDDEDEEQETELIAPGKPL